MTFDWYKDLSLSDLQIGKEVITKQLSNIKDTFILLKDIETITVQLKCGHSVQETKGTIAFFSTDEQEYWNYKANHINEHLMHVYNTYN